MKEISIIENTILECLEGASVTKDLSYLIKVKELMKENKGKLRIVELNKRYEDAIRTTESCNLNYLNYLSEDLIKIEVHGYKSLGIQHINQMEKVAGQMKELGMNVPDSIERQIELYVLE